MKRLATPTKQLNVAISPAAHRIATTCAEEAGMLVRKWVERAIIEYGRGQPAAVVGIAPAKERTLEPFND